LTSEQGAVKGAGYYVERPTRIESDGVAQCHAVDAFRRVAALNRTLGVEAAAKGRPNNDFPISVGDSPRPTYGRCPAARKSGQSPSCFSAAAKRYEELAERIRQHFVIRFWVKDHFAEYLHPQRGLISSHGLTDVDWAALALGVATPEQQAILWPQLKDEPRFHYGGMPTGIATLPETYEDWEFSHPDRHDLAAMGRVWYLEARARARMGDAEGLLAGIRKVCQVGRRSGYFWRERYHLDGQGGVTPAGAERYCEYPANLIRIVQRFLLGVELRLDGSLVLAPTATTEFWDRGFGQTLAWRDRTLQYRMQRDRVTGAYAGGSPQRLGLRWTPTTTGAKVQVLIDGRPAASRSDNGLIFLTLPAADPRQPCPFEISQERSEQATFGLVQRAAEVAD
jgi:hypothetical protein